MLVDENAKLIKLTQNKSAIVDRELYEELSRHKWYAMASGSKYYAARNMIVNGIGTLVLMHRQIVNADPNRSVEHLNGNCLDNRKGNLRLI